MKSQRVRLSDVRRIFRLLGRVRELRWSSTQGQYLVDGLVKLLDADRGFGGSFSDFADGHVPTYRRIILGSTLDPALASYFEMMGREITPADDPMVAFGCLSRRAIDAITHHALPPYYRSRRFDTFEQIVQQYRMADNLSVWFRHSARPSDISGFALHRLGNARPFSARERRVAMLFTEEYGRLYEAGLLSPPSVFEQLTGRQRQILDAVFAGRAPKQIATELGLSIHTIRDHLKVIYDKLGVEGTPGLLRLVMDGQGADPPHA